MDSAIQTGSLNVTLLWAMKYRPKNIKKDIKSRKQHSFLYIEDGAYRFFCEKGSFLAGKGDLVYIPKGSNHRYEVVDKNTLCHQIEFELGDPSFVFSAFPIKLEKSENAIELIVNAVQCFHTGDLTDHFSALGGLCELCALLAGQIRESIKKKSRIRPATEYIEKHCHEKIEIITLAELCHLSLSQMRRCFANELHSTPTAYKNALRIEKAKRILCNDDINISEAAQRLGFENIYIFSKTFKKYAGISPTQFVKAFKNTDK
ncbi:MAG: helix-turn-helix transcriptional regulator [Clostridia bacterium]|nr:helix-turn-helix transcriptional regulator [Clostridia bacterium]